MRKWWDAGVLSKSVSPADYGAIEAERYGWVNRAMPDSEIMSHVGNLARRIAGVPPAAVASIKSVVSRMTAIDTATFADESTRFRSQLASAESTDRLRWGLQQGLNAPGEFELHLGRLLAEYSAPANGS